MTAVAAARRAHLTQAMAEAGLDLLALYGNAWQSDYLRYATDFGILEGEAVAIVDVSGGISLFLDSKLETDRARLECPDLKTIYAAQMPAAIRSLLECARGRHLAAAPFRLLPRRIAACAEPFTLVDATAVIDRLLMKKLDAEIAAMRKAAHLADDGYAVLRRAARPGRADYELIAEVEAFFRAIGAEDNFMLIGVGGREVRAMTPPTGRRLKAGDLVTTELTPCLDGYYLQICRTLVVGEASPAQQRAFAVFREALAAGIAAVKPGATAADVARAENDVFRAHGLGEYVGERYTRVRGHGLGLFVDTKPHILETVPVVLESNMALIVHPNTYHPEVGYMVLGDAVMVTAGGADILTRTPRELFTVPA